MHYAFFDWNLDVLIRVLFLIPSQFSVTYQATYLLFLKNTLMVFKIYFWPPACRILVPHKGPWQWKPGVLTTVPPGNPTTLALYEGIYSVWNKKAMMWDQAVYLPTDISMFYLSFLSPKSQRNSRIHVLCSRKIDQNYKKAMLFAFLGL